MSNYSKDNPPVMSDEDVEYLTGCLPYLPEHGYSEEHIKKIRTYLLSTIGEDGTITIIEKEFASLPLLEYDVTNSPHKRRTKRREKKNKKTASYARMDV